MTSIGRFSRLAFVAAGAALLAGCTVTDITGRVFKSVSALETRYFASDEDVQAGLRHFSEGAFALAQERFQKAVEAAPNDPAAWMGLAASYDRLGRFDLADRAYDRAAASGVAAISYYNNRGYSMMLRGDLIAARKLFEKALALDPDNASIINNLRLLDGSRAEVRRLKGAY